jgi:hypothetical protein
VAVGFFVRIEGSANLLNSGFQLIMGHINRWKAPDGLPGLSAVLPSSSLSCLCQFCQNSILKRIDKKNQA